jgi:prevent-host-death family protein
MEKHIGIRQFRDEMTRHLGQVRRGVRITITDRGNPVARVLPYVKDKLSTQQERMSELLASGHIAPAERPFLARLIPIKGKGARPSRFILEERR